MADLNAKIGRRIRKLRHERRSGVGRRVRHMTIEDLAESARLSADYVAKVEQGRHSPTADTLAAIATALRVTPGALFPRTDADVKTEAIDNLVSFASGFGPDEIEYLLEVARVVMKRPQTRRAVPVR